MRKITLISVILLFVSHLSLGQELFKRVQIQNPSHTQLLQMAEVGIDLRCGAIQNENSIQIEIKESELQQLHDFGINYKIITDDLSSFYKKRANAELPSAIIELETQKSNQSTNTRSSVSNVILDNQLQYTGCSEIDWAIPTNFNLGSMGGCLTISEMVQELDDMNTVDAWDIVSAKQDASPSGQTTWGNPTSTITNNGRTYIGQSGSRWDPQTIYYVRITGNESTTEEGTKPQMLFTSMIHSREVSALMSNIYFMWYIIENYNTDPAVKHLVDNNELYFIPVVNPDGLRWNEHLSPTSGGGMQRKNLRPNGSNITDPNNGVDLNRNFDYFWGSAGSGSSGSSGSDSYRGPSAASEPETQIIVDFALDRNFETALWNHTYANVIPHPYGGNPSFVSGREDEMHKMHEDMTKYNRYVSGATIFTPANGIADDWMVGGAEDGNGSFGMDGHTAGAGREILATTPEHGGSGFWPSPANITPEAKRSVRISFMNAYYGGKYAKFHDLTQSDINGLSADLDFGIERIGQTASDFTLTVTPISTNIANITTPAVQTGMTLLEQRNITATLTLNSGIQPNDKIEYNVKLSNDDAIFYDINIEKYYQPNVLFEDNPDVNGITNWNASGGWITTTTNDYSGAPTTSIKDGSAVPYANNSTKTLTTSNTYNLSGANEILVQFYTKWDIERNFDFVEILGSTNGTNWQPLCGNYTKPESSSSTNEHALKSASDESFQGNQSSGQVYDGDRFDNWVMEEILIDGTNNSFLNGATTAQFRFNFRSDSENESENYSTTSDGFFFDDFKIISVQVPCETNIPTSIAISNLTPTSADVSWDNIPSATYDIRYREIGAPSWTEVTDYTANNYNITGLTAPKDYEVQVRTRCTSTTSAYSASTNFSILSCTGDVVNTFPYSEGFESATNSGFGLWTQGSTDDIDWTRESGPTPSNTSGPTGPDAASENSFYIFTESSGNNVGNPNKVAILTSPCIDLSNHQNASFSFYYHMFGASMGNLVLEVSNNDGTTWTQLETITGQQQTSSAEAWLQHTEDISAYDGNVIKLRITVTTGSSFASDISIDDINLTADNNTLNVGINEFRETKIYPNPFNNSVNIDLPSDFMSDSIEISIYDMHGRVLSESSSTGNTQINVDGLKHLSEGTYFIKVTNKSRGNFITKSLVKY